MHATRRSFIRTWSTAACAALMPFRASATLDNTVAGRPSQPEFRVTWLGGPTMVIAFGRMMILTDPMLGASFSMGDPNDRYHFRTLRNHPRLTPLPGIDLKMIDLVLLSHAHEDHFDQQAWIELDRSLPILLPIDDVKSVAAKGFQALDGMHWGERRSFNSGTGRVTITAMPARHSRRPKIAQALGQGNGYWIELSEATWRRAIYWTGDSMPTDDVVQAVKARGRPDLLVADVGGVGPTGPFGQISMRAADVVALARAVRPRYVLPIHHSTYSFYREPIGVLAVRSDGEAYGLDLIAAGTTVVYR